MRVIDKFNPQSKFESSMERMKRNMNINTEIETASLLNKENPSGIDCVSSSLQRPAVSTHKMCLSELGK